jgi:flagellar biosynthesis component FlhA
LIFCGDAIILSSARLSCPGLVLFTALCLGVWAHRKDQADKKKEKEEEEQAEAEAEKEKEKEKEKGKGAEGEEEEEKRIQWLIRESLPTFAKVRNYWKLLLNVLKTKHDW